MSANVSCTIKSIRTVNLVYACFIINQTQFENCTFLPF